MRERSSRLCRIVSNQASRAAYIKAKLSVLVPSQIRCLRLKSTRPPMPRQKDLARATGLHQSRISMFETPGAANITLETLANVAAGLKVGVIVKFVSFSEMLRWENGYSQDTFDVRPRLEQDESFLNPVTTGNESRDMAAGFESAANMFNPAKKAPQSERMSGASWEGYIESGSASGTNEQEMRASDGR
jgi:transcriptional regulator with XRE-family HTH domain